MPRADRRARLDQPVAPRRGVPRPHYDPEAFGRFSERIARFLGTARFLVYMTAFVMFWVFYNVVAPREWRFDEYPFIFLTLILSLQASYAAPLILLAQNRQADRDRVNLEEDRGRSELQTAETEFLTREVADIRIALGDLATRDFLRSQLQELVEQVADRVDGTPGGGKDRAGRRGRRPDRDEPAE